MCIYIAISINIYTHLHIYISKTFENASHCGLSLNIHAYPGMKSFLSLSKTCTSQKRVSRRGYTILSSIGEGHSGY